MATPKIPNARYAHTNLVASDWKHLADFYTGVFGCVPLEPQRDYSGDGIDRLFSLANVRLQGIHLRLPGCGEHGPTLEIFSYWPSVPAEPQVPNRSGYGHLAFEVPCVETARTAVIAWGGCAVGDVVQFVLANGSAVTAAYVTDPEGNIIELQSWSEA